jgi:ferrochelatase
MRWQPAIRIAPPYFEAPAYVDAIATSISDHLARVDFEPEALIASFHGMPQKYLEAGDPYHCQCQKTSRLVREKLGWPTERWHTTFQSQFGSDPWLQPYTIDTVERLGKAGVKRLAIVSPGFSADCLETLEELDMENRAKFLENGGEKFTYVPCLNDSPLGMGVIEQIARRELSGWI